jgi:hypothetical protein
MAYSRKHLSSEELLSGDQEQQVMFYVNPLNKGIAFSRTEISSYIEQIKIKSHPKYYSPCHNIDIIKTLVYNQLSCYDQNGNTDKAQQLKGLFDMFRTEGPEMPDLRM